MKKKKKKVMVFGTFAILHPGHLYFFRQAKKFSNYLIVVIARDVTVKKIKGFLPKLDEQERWEMVEALNLVDKTVLGDKVNWYKVILKYKPDVICLGYDQKTPDGFEKTLEEMKISAEIYRLKSYKPEKYKSSKFLKS
jgi:FAD synthetase